MPGARLSKETGLEKSSLVEEVDLLKQFWYSLNLASADFFKLFISCPNFSLSLLSTSLKSENNFPITPFC